jgi:hypothetical protein
MKTKTDKVIKGMVFAGCSFTWGQGLYFYSNLPTLVEPKPHHYDQSLVKETHRAFMRAVRHPRLVANHFNTYELTQPFNGGSHQSILNWWKACFSDNPNWNTESTFPVTKINYSDVSHVVFQLTQPHRCGMLLHDKDNNPYFRNYHTMYEPQYHEDLERWLKKHNLTEDKFQEHYINESLTNVREFLQEIESKGIKVVLFTWPTENAEYVKNDPWMRGRFLTFKYKNTEYDSIQEMMRLNPELEILRDRDNFEIPPGDHHPSLKCHQVMAENIIDYIEKIE